MPGDTLFPGLATVELVIWGASYRVGSIEGCGFVFGVPSDVKAEPRKLDFPRHAICQYVMLPGAGVRCLGEVIREGGVCSCVTDGMDLPII